MAKTLSPDQLSKEGKSLFKKSDYPAAANAFESARVGYEAMGDNLNAAEMANNASVAYLQAGEAGQAYGVVQGTAEVFAAASDFRREGMALGNLGAALEALGRFEEATEAYLQSAEVFEKAGETDLRLQVMQSLSTMQLNSGRRLQALATMQSALEGLERPTPKQKLLKRLLDSPFKMLNR